MLGYADPSKLAVLEVSRAQLRTAHTYSDPKPQAFGSGNGATAVVNDGGTVSRAGAQLDFQFTSVPAAAFVVTLRSPSGRTQQWTSAELGPLGAHYHLCAPDFAGDQCAGTWTVGMQVLVFNTTVPALKSCSVFVEGAGPKGLGGDIVSWGVYVDPALAGKGGAPADIDGTRETVARIKHAHTTGYVLTSLNAIPDDPSSLPDACLPA
jgi:hypothetical protein